MEYLGETMGRKRRAYQKRKEQKEMLKDIFGVVVIFVVGFILVWSIVNNAVAVRNIRQNTLEEYTGSYSLELERSYGKHPNYYYRITLDNGDILSIRKSLCENPQILEKRQIMTFRYAENVRSGLFSPCYTALSIETADSNAILIDLETSHRISVRSIWAVSVLLVIWVFLFGGLFLIAFYADIRDKWRRTRKKISHE
jgi:hypothetical protein